MLTIGQFSRACSVTVKTLRHYDRIGLLRPSLVDAESGYRYYEEESISIMLLIQRLKRYGFSLGEIREILLIREEPSRIKRRLMGQRERLCESIERANQTLRELDAHVESLERTGDWKRRPERPGGEFYSRNSTLYSWSH